LYLSWKTGCQFRNTTEDYNMSVHSHPPIRSIASSILFIIFFLSISVMAQAAQVTLAWDPNSPAPEGYRIYQRLGGEGYDYTAPVWPKSGDDPTQTSCTISGLDDDASYFFVVRAFVGNDESGDSNEVNYVTPPVQTVNHTITVITEANGAISPGSATVAAGENQAYAISPDTGYRIEDVQVDGASVGPVSTYTFYQVDADHTIQAFFSANAYEISASKEGNGSISPAGIVSVAAGTEQRYTITPGSDSVLADVLVDGQSIGGVGSYTFTNVNATHSIHAIFEVLEHIIVASAGPNGDISPSGQVAVQEGDDLIITVTPHSGYRIEDVTVDGVSVGPVAHYTFSQVAAGHTITAGFTQETYTITASSSAGGSISPPGIISTSAGSSHTFLITAEAGYEIDDVTVDGQSVGKVSSYTFFMVDGDHTIDAVFKPVNQIPVADAGPDQVVDEQSLVTLSGLNSVDADDGIAVFQWRQIGGPLVNLSSENTEIVSFVAPDVDTTGEALEFELIVTDYSGDQASDRCIVNVTWVNMPPVAAAGEDQTLSEGETVVLNGVVSTDPDDGIASYRWRQVVGPHVVLSNPDSPSPSFLAPDVGPDGATLTFELTVTDNGGLQDTDSCGVTVTWSNAEPIAEAGPDHQVSAGSDVQLDGSASTDPEGLPLSFQWRQTFGPPVTLTDPTAVRPMFSVPVDGFDGLVLTFELTVTDSGGLQGVDTCDVVVSASEPPADVTPPMLAILSPAEAYVTVNSPKYSLAGNASDDTGVVRVVWQNSAGDSGEAVGTIQWRIEDVRLRFGDNRVTVTAIDAAGNEHSQSVILHREKSTGKSAKK
jgi:hypothetical protein